MLLLSHGQEADGIVSGARPLSRLDSSPAPLFEELRFGLWGVVLWLASALGIIAGERRREVLVEEVLCLGEVSLVSIVWRCPASVFRSPCCANATLHIVLLVHVVFTCAGITPDASTETLPSAEGREYEVALEEEWGLRAVAALEEPYPESRQATPEARAEGEVVLLLACLCRGLGTTYVVRVPEILSR